MKRTVWTKGSSRFILKPVVVIVLFAVLGAIPLAAGERAEGKLSKRDNIDLREQILWFGPGESNPIFVPEALLAETPLESAPVTDTDKDVLRTIVDKFQDPRWGSRCDSNISGPMVQGTAEEAKSFEEILRDQEIVFVGEIVEIVPGWGSWTLRVARMVYVEVQEVLRGEGQKPGVSPGSVVGLYVSGGTARIAGTVVCQDTKAEFYQPVLGDQVVVGGKVLESDENFFYRRVLFPVVGGEVLAQPYPQLEDTEIARDLRRLGRRLEADREQQ